MRANQTYGELTELEYHMQKLKQNSDDCMTKALIDNQKNTQATLCVIRASALRFYFLFLRIVTKDLKRFKVFKGQNQTN